MVINGVGELSRGTIEDYDASFECERTIISLTVSGRAGNIWIFWSDAIGPFIPSCVHFAWKRFLIVFFFSPHHHHHCLRCGNPPILTVIQTLSLVLFSVSWFHKGGKITSGQLLFLNSYENFSKRSCCVALTIVFIRGGAVVLWRDGWVAESLYSFFE